ncbi:MAG: GIY-YIG nuclease family protein [Candidatus Magasanikbacteria bacterium]|nr:GIY-YIG nuclease family protein [Candidatus Magasanikbacteria bacterium]
MQNIKKKIQNLPDKPGIYLFYCVKKQLIYVGKATSLKSRVRSYFAGQRTSRPIEELIHEVKNIKYKQTDSVLEAVILEAIYIKKYEPKYNVKGKDDKSWNYIIFTKDEFSRVLTLRQHTFKQFSEKEIKKKYLKIFGPFPGLKSKETLAVLRRIFHFSVCKPNAKRSCMYYQMHQCEGVCVGEISAKDYKRKIVNPLGLFLNGKKKILIKQLKIRMKESAKKEEFEEARRLRNQIFSLQEIRDIALINKSFVANIEDEKKLKRIEGYDISNLGETGKVGSMVVFENGEANKSKYRKFKIRTVKGQNDTACLEEVIRRRLRHSGAVDIDEQSNDKWLLPNVFLIDGGKPQVNRVKKILKEFSVEIPVVGIAKGAKRKKNEFIFDQINYKLVEENKETFIKVRDEAHRFAINYQRKLRKIR